MPDIYDLTAMDTIAQLTELERMLDGKEYCAASSCQRGRQFTVTIPWDRFYSTPIYRVMWRAVRLLVRSLWHDLTKKESAND